MVINWPRLHASQNSTVKNIISQSFGRQSRHTFDMNGLFAHLLPHSRKRLPYFRRHSKDGALLPVSDGATEVDCK